jgi:hypothetical protein
MLILGLMASAWAMSLIIIGLWLVFEQPLSLVLPPRWGVLVGISSIAAGNLVFMYTVADRVFPSVRERQAGWCVEMFTLAVVLMPLVIGVRLL